MKLFVFSSRTGWGEFLIGIVHYSVDLAFEYKNIHGKSIKDKGWNISDLEYSVDVINTEIGIAFEGGGD